MLDPHFQIYSPGSRRHYEFVEAGEQALLTGEVRRLLDRLAAAAPARIAKGGYTQEQAEAVQFLWLAIVQDLEAQEHWLAELRRVTVPAWTVADRLAELRRENGVAWETKVEALRREIQWRRDNNQADVDKGQVTAEDAKAQLERLEAVHYLYWMHGYGFDGTVDEGRDLGAARFEALQQQQAA